MRPASPMHHGEAPGHRAGPAGIKAAGAIVLMSRLAAGRLDSMIPLIVLALLGAAGNTRNGS